MTAYYNEIDPYAAQWLRNLIAAGHIAPGDVDERSIEDVNPADLRAYTQCHFFAGIGVWSRALRLAGWPDSRPVWTGSCPCQPFSAAGKGGGFDDERHLWPAFHHLISQRRPPVVFGEQVASKDGLAWLDLVQADLEGADYASAAVDLCAAGVGAPHIRQRLYWVADTTVARKQRNLGDVERPRDPELRKKQERPEYDGSGEPSRAGNASDEPRERGASGVLGTEAQEHGARVAVYGSLSIRPEHASEGVGRPTSSPTKGLWRDADWLFCRDEKWRPVEPGTFPLAHGVAARVGRLRAYGNAIVPQVAAEVIRAYMWTHAEVVMAEMT
jgi:DNA (cytosine-5)-methyltransferase 1